MPTVIELRNLGHDVLTSYESGKAGRRISDPEVMQFAIEEQRILVTLDRRHFIRLHQENSNHFGIIVCTFDANFVGLAKRIDSALTDLADFRGQLIRVNRPQ